MLVEMMVKIGWKLVCKEGIGFNSGVIGGSLGGVKRMYFIFFYVGIVGNVVEV